MSASVLAGGGGAAFDPVITFVAHIKKVLQPLLVSALARSPRMTSTPS